MNWLDVIVVVLVLGFGVMGWMHGIIRLGFTLAGGILGVVARGKVVRRPGAGHPYRATTARPSWQRSAGSSSWSWFSR